MKFILLPALPLVAYALPSGTFSYKPDSDKAPNAWPGIDLGLNAIGAQIDNQCGGAGQSGIDIPLTTCDTFDDYVFAGGSCSLDDIDFDINDHAIVATYNTARNGCTAPRMRIPGQDRAFDVLQFHLHTGTDHALGGEYFGSCMHLVHKEVGSGRLSVLGFFLEPTDRDGTKKFSDLLSAWEAVAATTILACKLQGTSIWSSQTRPLANDADTTAQQAGVPEDGVRHLDAAQQGQRRLPRSFNPYDLIPKGSTMYTYEGSLTTPPCTEVVFWNVIDTPVKISVREFLRLTNLIVDYANLDTCKLASEAAPSGFTGRPVQAINGREITRICPKGFEDPLVKVECPEPEVVVEPTGVVEQPSDEDSSAVAYGSVVVASTLVTIMAVAALM